MKVQVNDPCTFEVDMIPFVFSVAPSVVTVAGHRFVGDAVVVAVTELQRLEVRPVKVILLIWPVPSSEFVTVPSATEEVEVTVLMTTFEEFVTLRTTLPLLLATILPVY
jgi:hypothetical protein